MDKIAFAQLVSYFSKRFGLHFDADELRDIDNAIINGMPKPEPVIAQPVKANPVEIRAMLEAVRDGRKIDAIKAHRQLTGFGLKESKDAIEAAWPNRDV